jgi:hypothetical protein
MSTPLDFDAAGGTAYPRCMTNGSARIAATVSRTRVSGLSILCMAAPATAPAPAG